MNQNLFSEFSTGNVALGDASQITKKDWLIQVNKDLKGKNFADTLVWQTSENFAVQPYYAAEDVANLPIKAIQAVQKNASSGGWQNCPLLKYTDEKTTNALIISYLKKGSDAVTIDFGEITINEINFIKLLSNIKLSESPIYFKTFQGLDVLANLAKFVHYQPKGGFRGDIIARSFSTTTTIINQETWKNAKEIIKNTSQYPHFQAFSVESHVFHNAGANAVQELAFTLASAITYLDQLTDLGLTIEEIVPKLEFSVSVGTNYFMEIAKLRALRYLWSKILESYDCPLPTVPCSVHCQTSSFYEATLSPYTNMLRATTEAMSAVIGGCNSLTILPYDAVFGSDSQSDFSERIARNIALIMKEEAFFDKTNDPAAGSYYIENLTNQLATSAWELCLKVENLGGILVAFQQGFIQSEIEKSYQEKIKNLQNGKIMVGVNKFRVETETTAKEQKEAVLQGNILQNRRISEIYE